ncbi:MAG: transglycosylase domain-containing protein [Micromonosporaceae bacterium]
MDPHERQGGYPNYGDGGYGESGYDESGYDRSGYGQSGYDDGYSAGYAEDGYEGYGEYGDQYAPAPRRGRLRRLLRRKKLMAAIGALVILGGGALVASGYYSSIAVPDSLALPETTTVYYADGKTVMATLGRQRREIVDVTTLPDQVTGAVVAAEDPGFWSGSRTNIARQYVRLAANITDSSTLTRIRVAIMAGKLEDKYSKTDILSFYLNAIYFGRGTYGIGAASQAYFGKPAESLTAAEAIVLAGVIRSPEDGAYDPTVNAAGAQQRFETVKSDMARLGRGLDAASAAGLTMPTVLPYDPKAVTTGMEKPTGLVVQHALSELRQTPQFKGKPKGFIENGGFSIVTTVNPLAQALLEKTADETVTDSAMFGQPDNLQAAASVVEPGTGRVLAYFGGHNGNGSDFAGWYYDEDGQPAGYGAHQPGGTFEVYALAAALKDGISIKSYWNARSPQEFPESGRTGKGAVRNRSTAKCQPACNLVDATVAGLDTVYFGLTETVGAAAVLEMARAAGVNDMWAFETDNQKVRIDLAGLGNVADVVPLKFANEIGLGQYPVTVLDQANSMATFSAGGLRAQAHFVREVRRKATVVYSERLPAAGDPRVLSQAALDDLTYVLSQTSAGKLSGRSSASRIGTWLLGSSTTETAHAWIVGYTGNLAMAVWVGNKADEKALRNKAGQLVLGSGLPATIYRAFMTAAHTQLNLKKVTFAPPRYVGDDTRGNTPAPA